MEALKCIETRRSVRKFTDKPIEKTLVAKLAQAAQLAPTWKNSQTTRFTALSERKVLDELCGALPSYNAAIVRSAPLLIAVSAVKGRSGFEKDGTPTTILGEAYTYFDCGATVQTLCLAANDCGIGTVILGIFDHDVLRTVFRIPETENLVALVACGYKNDEPQMPPRRPLNDILKFI